jgi:SAM-dependent methyltransferase
MRHLPGIVQPLAPAGAVLAVSHSSSFARHLGLDGPITEANYPTVSFVDLPFADGAFEAVVSDQVLEHVAGSPQRCFDETYRVLRPGGLAVHTTVFVYPVHGSPSDYWRFTPMALRLLAETAGLEVIEVAGWGNFPAWWAIRSGLLHEGVPESPWHPYHKLATFNDAMWPIVVWVVARRPG